MDLIFRLGTFFFDLVGPLAVGYFLHQKNLMSDHTNQMLIDINIRVLITVLAWLSFWILPFSLDVLLMPVFGVIVTIAPFFLGYIFFGKLYPNPFDRGSFLINCMLGNVGVLAGLVSYILYGEIGFAYVQLIAAAQNMLTLSVAFPTAQFYQRLCEKKSSRAKLNINFREFFLTWNQIGLLGMILGIALQFFGIERPQILGTLFQSLVHISVWIAIIPVGYLIDFEKARQWYKKSLPISVVHFILLPIVTVFLAKMLVSDEVVQGIILIVSTCPSAINSVIATKLYKLNVDLSIASYMSSTTAYLFFIFPAVLWLLH